MKLYDKLLKEYEDYTQEKLYEEVATYLKKCFQEAFLAGQIKGLKQGIKAKQT